MRRLESLKAQGPSLVRVGMEVSEANDFLIQLTQGNFTNALKPSPTTPELRASRQRPYWMGEFRIHRRISGDLRRLATASRPGNRARGAQLAARVNARQGSEICRTNDLEKTVEEGRQATVPTNAEKLPP